MKIRVHQVDHARVLMPLAEVYAEPNPFDSSEMLYPAGTRRTELLPYGSGQILRSTGPDLDAPWEVVDDFRGSTYWLPSGEKITISEAGVRPPEDALFIEPPVAIAAKRRLAIKAELQQIDSDGARPAREIALALVAGGTAPAAAVDKVQALEAQAQTLRAELATLGEVA